MLRRATFALTLALAVLSTGCAEFLRMLRGGVQTPTAAFQSAQLDSVTLDDAQVSATFAITNPNPIGLNLAGIGYAVTFDGRPLFEGNLPNGIQLAANGTSPLTVPVKIPFASLASFATTLATKTEAPYEVRGAVTVHSPIGDLTVPIHWGGVVPLPQLPKLSVSGARVDNVSFTGARLVVSLAVNNPNAFALPLTALSGHIMVADQKVAALTIPGTKPLAAKAITTIDIPVDVSFMSAGMAVSTAMARKSATVRLQGSATVAGKTLPLDIGTTIQ